jgi:threonine/homoserine/homoserine lactone efflux protein
MPAGSKRRLGRRVLAYGNFMPSYQTLSAFFGVAILLALTPGPDNLFVLTQSALSGRKAGLCVVLGLCTGLVVHTAAVAAGLAAVFASSALAFTLLKMGGAAYLAYLAWQAFRAPASTATGDAARSGNGALYRRGVLMSLTNPKLLMFFLAFLPQFTDPARGPVGPQVAVLGALFIVAAMIIFSAIAFFSGWAATVLMRSPRAQRTLNRLAGLVFAGLALKLASASR